MYYYRSYNDGIVNLIPIQVFWTELDLTFLGSERAKGKGWVAPYALF